MTSSFKSVELDEFLNAAWDERFAMSDAKNEQNTNDRVVAKDKSSTGVTHQSIDLCDTYDLTTDNDLLQVDWLAEILKKYGVKIKYKGSDVYVPFIKQIDADRILIYGNQTGKNLDAIITASKYLNSNQYVRFIKISMIRSVIFNRVAISDISNNSCVWYHVTIRPTCMTSNDVIWEGYVAYLGKSFMRLYGM